MGGRQGSICLGRFRSALNPEWDSGANPHTPRVHLRGCCLWYLDPCSLRLHRLRGWDQEGMLLGTKDAQVGERCLCTPCSIPLSRGHTQEQALLSGAVITECTEGPLLAVGLFNDSPSLSSNYQLSLEERALSSPAHPLAWPPDRISPALCTEPRSTHAVCSHCSAALHRCHGNPHRLREAEDVTCLSKAVVSVPKQPPARGQVEELGGGILPLNRQTAGLSPRA